MYQTRKSIETGIICAVLEAEAYPEVANFLSAKNFKTVMFQQIFFAAQKLYPTRPVNLISIKLELETMYKDESLDAINFIYDRGRYAYTKTFIKYWCLILLQMDIKNSFRDELINWKSERDKEHSLVESSVIEEIFLNVTEEVDILLLIEKSMEYFEKHKMTIELNKALEFNENVVKKALLIKKNVSLEIALANIFKIAETSTEVKYQCNKFAAAIAEMTITNKVNNNYRIAADLL